MKTDNEVLATWDTEVAQILKDHYKDLDGAINAVIGSVLKKMKCSVLESKKAAKFLYIFITTDPSLMQEIREITGQS